MPGPRHRVHVLDAAHLREHLLGGVGHQRLDVARRGAGERHEHVRHRDVDLRLLLARRDRDREQAQQQRDQRGERRELRVLEELRDAAGDAHRLRAPAGAARRGPCRPSPARARRARRASGRRAPRPRARRPRVPSRTWRSRGAPLVVDDVDGGHLAAAEHRLARHQQARRAADGEVRAREHARIDAAHVVGQLEAHARGVRARVGRRARRSPGARRSSGRAQGPRCAPCRAAWIAATCACGTLATTRSVDGSKPVMSGLPGTAISPSSTWRADTTPL